MTNLKTHINQLTHKQIHRIKLTEMEHCIFYKKQGKAGAPTQLKIRLSDLDYVVGLHDVLLTATVEEVLRVIVDLNRED